jgi:hypothetical protein
MAKEGIALMYAEAVATFVRLMIRLSPDLHDWLSKLAEREHRSLNGQIVHILEQARGGNS